MRIVLTGVTGYLGSNLAIALLKHGHSVIGLKRGSSSTNRINNIIDSLTLVDIERINFDSIFHEYGRIDVIIHTATNYGRNNDTIVDIFNANTFFPLCLLDAGAKAGVHGFLNTDTILDKYLNIYAFSKNQLLDWGRFFAIREKIAFWNLKLEHFYGAHDDPAKFTAFIINSCLSNIPEIQLTPGYQRRDFIYIDDVVSAYLTLLDEIHVSPLGFKEYEIGSGVSIPIRDFVSLVKKLTGAITKLNFSALPYRDGEVMYSAANIIPLRELGWHCKHDIETGIIKLLATEANIK